MAWEIGYIASLLIPQWDGGGTLSCLFYIYMTSSQWLLELRQFKLCSPFQLIVDKFLQGHLCYTAMLSSLCQCDRNYKTAKMVLTFYGDVISHPQKFYYSLFQKLRKKWNCSCKRHNIGLQKCFTILGWLNHLKWLWCVLTPELWKFAENKKIGIMLGIMSAH